jgi:hypothetical protein
MLRHCCRQEITHMMDWAIKHALVARKTLLQSEGRHFYHFLLHDIHDGLAPLTCTAPRLAELN